MRQVADGFSYLFFGAKEIVKRPKTWWLLVVPVLINLGLFGVFAYFAVMDWFPWLQSVIGGGTVQLIFGWIFVIALSLIGLVLYAFLFSIISEIIGAPFYEGLGGMVDRAYGAKIVERSWYMEVKIAISQESRKLFVVIVISIVVFAAQFIPVAGQIFSSILGFCVLVLTMGGDAVGPALARRGLLLGERRKWVIAHLQPVIGLGLAKSFGLFIPFLNVIVLPMASAGGTLLVQKYDKGK